VQRAEKQRTENIGNTKQNAKNLGNPEQRAENTRNAKKRINFLKRVFFPATMDSSFHGTIVLVWMLLTVTSSNSVSYKSKAW
jgi:hypothetical protein